MSLKPFPWIRAALLVVAAAVAVHAVSAGDVVSVLVASGIAMSVRAYNMGHADGEREAIRRDLEHKRRLVDLVDRIQAERK